jgi:hypothetical protein
METVYLYKSGDTIRVFPGVVVVRGGQQFEVVNAIGVTMKVSLPEDARHQEEPASRSINSKKRTKIRTRKQGDDNTRAYEYTAVSTRGRRARGNSDPVLIIEN